MRTKSIENGYADAHKSYRISQAQDVYKQQIYSCTQITVFMHKISINNGSAQAHKLYYISHAQDNYKQRFSSFAQIILELSWADFYKNGSEHANKLY
jgi:hypothetical protein